MAAGVISDITALTNGGLQTMSLTKQARIMMSVMILGLLGGATFLIHQARAVEPVLEAAVQGTPCAPVPENPGVVLKWKFVKDRPFYQVLTTQTDQQLKVMGNDVNQTQKQTYYFRWTPSKQTGAVWELKQKIEGVTMDIDIGQQRIHYDSTARDAPGDPLSKFFQALVGTEFTVTLDTAAMKVTRLSGREEFFKKMSEGHPERGNLLENILSDSALKEMAEPFFAALPHKKVSVGEKWQRARTIDLGPVGKWENNCTYTYEGLDGKLDKIKVAPKLKYQEPPNQGGAGLPFKITKAELKDGETGGILLYDRNSERVASLEWYHEMMGKMVIDIGGQATEVELTQKQKATAKFTDANPLKAKE